MIIIIGYIFAAVIVIIIVVVIVEEVQYKPTNIHTSIVTVQLASSIFGLLGLLAKSQLASHSCGWDTQGLISHLLL